MTEQQALRQERIRMREELRRQRIVETIQGVVLVALLVLAFAFAGTLDFEDEQRALAFWESQGVTIQRW